MNHAYCRTNKSLLDALKVPLDRRKAGEPTEKIKVQRPRPSIPSESQGGRREASLFQNLRQSASQNLSEKNIAVLTAQSFLERFCEAD